MEVRLTTTLLGVDDSKTMRKVLEITFAGESFRTLLAENANDAMSKLHAERPNVVLVDAGLEGVGGYELCRQVKAAAPEVCVLLLSSKQQPYDRNRGAQAGADDFIEKPFDTQQAIDKVLAALRKSSGVQAAPQAPAGPATGALLQASPRPRAATLAYGSHFAAPAGTASPVAPLVPPVSTPGGASAAGPSTAARPVAARGAVAQTVASATFASTNGSELQHKLEAMGLTPEQMSGVLALSREVVERVVWEVVPVLAETLIKEEIRRLTGD